MVTSIIIERIIVVGICLITVAQNEQSPVIEDLKPCFERYIGKRLLDIKPFHSEWRMKTPEDCLQFCALSLSRCRAVVFDLYQHICHYFVDDGAKHVIISKGMVYFRVTDKHCLEHKMRMASDRNSMIDSEQQSLPKSSSSVGRVPKVDTNSINVPLESANSIGAVPLEKINSILVPSTSTNSLSSSQSIVQNANTTTGFSDHTETDQSILSRINDYLEKLPINGSGDQLVAGSSLSSKISEDIDERQSLVDSHEIYDEEVASPAGLHQTDPPKLDESKSDSSIDKVIPKSSASSNFTKPSDHINSDASAISEKNQLNPVHQSSRIVDQSIEFARKFSNETRWSQKKSSPNSVSQMIGSPSSLDGLSGNSGGRAITTNQSPNKNPGTSKLVDSLPIPSIKMISMKISNPEATHQPLSTSACASGMHDVWLAFENTELDSKSQYKFTDVEDYFSCKAKCTSIAGEDCQSFTYTDTDNICIIYLSDSLKLQSEPKADFSTRTSAKFCYSEIITAFSSCSDFISFRDYDLDVQPLELFTGLSSSRDGLQACIELCILASNFQCKSATFDMDAGKCSLRAEDSLSSADQFREHSKSNLIYFENGCQLNGELSVEDDAESEHSMMQIAEGNVRMLSGTAERSTEHRNP